MLRSNAVTIACVLLLCALTSFAQQEESVPGMPTPGSYKSPALSLNSLLQSDKTISDAMMAYARTGDSDTFRAAIQSAANTGDIGAELLLAEQYIPEECVHEPNRDVPDCGPDGKQPPAVVFRTNPLKIPASYESAALWLEKASAQGSGEASEVLAQLITRMLANGHATPYTAADSTRLHALARSQGFEVRRIIVTCFKRIPGTGALTIAGPLPKPFPDEKFRVQLLSDDELRQLQTSGLRGALHYEGGDANGDSVLLSRPEEPIVHIRVILDHDPGHEVHLPIPSGQDVIYLQRGDGFIAFPAKLPTLARSISLMPQRPDTPQVSDFIQNMDGGFSGGFCASF